jgi:hypothetical protein
MYNVVTGVPSTPTYTLTLTPLNGFSGAVSFSATPFYGCSNTVFNQAVVSGPWTSTLSMSCNEWLPNTYRTTVVA